jgi:TctA family transporter
MIFTNNRFWISVLLVVCGWLLARVGTNSSTMTEFMTFGNDYLRGGIPTITVLLGLFVVPCLTASRIIPKFDLIKNAATQIRFSLSDTLCHMSVIVRSGIVGFIAGLVPYVGVGTSSNLAYYIEKWVNPKDHVKQAVAAESANNAASVSVLIPFLAFGIAIQTSEGIMLDIMAQNNLMLSWNDVNVPMLFTMLVLSNIVAIVLAWPFAQQISNFYNQYSDYIMIVIVLLCAYTVLFMGTQVSQSWYYFLCLIVLGLAGFLIRHIDTLPLIFAFLLQDSLEPAIIRSIDILRFNLQL